MILHTKPFSILVCLVLIAWTGVPFSKFNLQQDALNVKIEKIDDLAFPKLVANVSVSDAEGFPIEGLKAENFQLTEDSKPVASFSATSFQNMEQPLAIVFAIDTSGSMSGKPLKDAVAATRNFANALAAQDQVGLISFTTEVKTLADLSTDRANFNQQLDNLKAQGNTSIYDALIDSINLLKNRSERRIILLLTDGRDTGNGKFQFDDAVNQAVRWSIPIYPVGFGSADKNELVRFAKLTGGIAQVNPDSSTLSTAFQNVLTMLREQYKLEYTSAQTADGRNHPLDITVVYANTYAAASRQFLARVGQVTVNVVQPASGQTVGGKVRFVVEPSAPAEVRQVDIQMDGNPLTTLTSPPFEYEWDSTLVNSGMHDVRVTTTDQVGNTGAQDLQLAVREPVLVKLDLTKDQVLSGAAKLTAQVDALVAVKSVEYAVDGQPVGSASAQPFEVSWNTQAVKPGSHLVSVKATDVNGYSNQDSVTVNVQLQNSSNLFWIVLIVALATVGLMLPIVLRRRRKLATPQPQPENEEVLTPLFSPADGNGQYDLIEAEGINPGHVWTLAGTELRLGRKRDENDIPLKGLNASRHHAIICQSLEGYEIQVLRPDNPVLVNGRAVTQRAVLSVGDVIEIGESVFSFERRI